MKEDRHPQETGRTGSSSSRSSRRRSSVRGGTRMSLDHRQDKKEMIEGEHEGNMKLMIRYASSFSPSCEGEMEGRREAWRKPWRR